MSALASLAAHTAEVLRFTMQGRTPAAPLPPLSTADLDRHAQRILRLVSASGKDRLALMGLGSGLLARRLAQSLPPAALLTCCELSPERVRAADPAVLGPGRNFGSGQAALLADTSSWAHACLLALCGFGPGRCLTVVNPELSKAERDGHQDLQRLLARLEMTDLSPRPGAHGLENLSCAAILSPEEPDLDGFLGQFPNHIRELCLVWDADEAPERAVPFALRQTAHALERDFAAQRNRMLALCSGRWVLCLDADERLPDGFWDRLPGLLARLDERPGLDGVFLPRLTLFPDQDHFRAGYGLWPDLQLRLFRNRPGLRYERPVHERLTGLDGDTALLPDQPILHLTHLLKRPEAIREKLDLFDAAAKGRVSHTLNPDFPSLPAAPPYLNGQNASPPMLVIPARPRARNQA